MRAERSSTIGTERLTNYALQIKSKEEFVAQLTSHLPARPEYFCQRRGDQSDRRNGARRTWLRCERSRRLNWKTMLREGDLALDVRPGEQFAAGHVPGSVNIALSGQFASWAGTVLGLDGTSGIDRRNGICNWKKRGSGWHASVSKSWMDIWRVALQPGSRPDMTVAYDRGRLPLKNSVARMTVR